MGIEPLLEPRDAALLWLRGITAVALCLMLFVVAATASEKDMVMKDHATGTFEVKMASETVAGKTPVTGVSQMSIDKTFHGDLEGTSRGSMISAGDPKAGEAGYVALEMVTGTLKGRAGSFALMHKATMSGGGRAMDITVVPGSGTDALKGLAGTFVIRIDNGQHSYDFDYTLPK
ncbi:MAG TPA: DUF3224 domain-containing protein [Rhizomicrobium sp.]|nr:DUF3224 domain-containing protein [Rhizomicrobium sp.]